MGTATTDLRSKLDGLLASHDRAGAVAAAIEAVESGSLGLRELYHDVLAPLMVDMGAGWQAGRARVWEEHLASTTVRTIIESLYPVVQRHKATAPALDRSVLLACPADELHDLGLRMLSDMFDVAGWRTYLLGADTPTLQIADAAKHLGVDLVVLSSTTLVDRVRVRHVLDEIEKRAPGQRVVVAGCERDCGERGLEPDEVFDAAEFFATVPATEG